ncbi:MAG TPA: ATP cone domain-containing protein [Candidatus Eisenbacteria bacterium]|nr:ATP cone domain-containing protein [Candidatus Eisenbacteria bacterium]
MTFVIKASGETEPFSEEKLRRSLERASVSGEVIDRVMWRIKEGLRDGMRTADIYRLAFALLKKEKKIVATRYALKKAIMALGPEGHHFERYAGELLRAEGYAVDVAKVLRGACVSHEVDLIARKDGRTIMAECKFHNHPGVKSDVKVPLYTKARFDDLKKAGGGPDEAWVITNTVFTGDAIRYAECVGMKAVGWNYPPDNSLQDIIRRRRLYPVTCLTGLYQMEKRLLLDKGVLLCAELLRDKETLFSLGMGEARAARVAAEISQL